MALLLLPLYPALAQDEYLPRIVKSVAGTSTPGDPRYGFITGISSSGTEMYAVMLSTNSSYFDQHPRVQLLLFDRDGRRKLLRQVEAERVPQARPIAIEEVYFVGVYRIAAPPPATLRQKPGEYVRLSTGDTNDYALYWDTNEDPNDFQPHFGKRDAEVLNQLVMPRGVGVGNHAVPFGFNSENHGGKVQAGMPVLNSIKKLVGLVATNVTGATSGLHVLSMQALQHALAGGKSTAAPGACTYFNLLEYGRDKTPCDSLQNEVRLRTLAKEQADAERARMTRDERIMVAHDRNYPFAVSLCVGGGLGTMYTRYRTSTAAGTKGSDLLDYSFELNFHLYPDVLNKTHLSIRPRYAEFRFSPPDDYATSSKVGFTPKQIRVRAIEVPLVLELVSSAGPGGEGHIGLGYVPGYQRAVDFDFTTTAATNQRREIVPGNQHYTHKLLAELGGSSGKLRITVNYTYEFRTFLRDDYELVIENEIQRPLAGVGGSYHHFGAELSYRLWGRWQTGLVRPRHKK